MIASVRVEELIFGEPRFHDIGEQGGEPFIVTDDRITPCDAASPRTVPLPVGTPCLSDVHSACEDRLFGRHNEALAPFPEMDPQSGSAPRDSCPRTRISLIRLGDSPSSRLLYRALPSPPKNSCRAGHYLHIQQFMSVAVRGRAISSAFCTCWLPEFHSVKRARIVTSARLHFSPASLCSARVAYVIGGRISRLASTGRITRVGERRMSTLPSTLNAGPTRPAIIGFRADAQDHAALVQLGQYWGLNATDVIRRLLRMAALSGKVRHSIDTAAQDLMGIPMPAKRYQLRSDWHGLIAGLGHYDFRCGDVIDGKVAARDLIDALLARDLLEPL